MFEFRSAVTCAKAVAGSLPRAVTCTRYPAADRTGETIADTLWGAVPPATPISSRRFRNISLRNMFGLYPLCRITALTRSWVFREIRYLSADPWMTFDTTLLDTPACLAT
jgi:hypothetical protein